MGVIAWIVLGLGAGLLANMLATKLFHVVTRHGFFNISTWLTVTELTQSADAGHRTRS
jgi:uncharacterized membrane protein YeaQ/YmgE (transglycosylase-associated protein family)